MNNHRMRRLLATISLTMIPFLLTGCSLGSANSNNSKKQSLTIWRQPYNKKLDDPAFEAIIAAYKKKYPNVTITYRSFEATEDYETAVVNALATDTRPDIWEIRNDELERHIDKIVPVPGATISDMTAFKKRYAPTIGDEMVRDGKFYGMPLGIDPLVLFLNQDHLNELDGNTRPKSLKTWEEVINLATTLTRKVGTTIFRPGIALGLGSNVDRSSQIFEMILLQLGTQMTDSANRTATFNLYKQDGEQFYYPGKEALNFYRSFADPASGFQTWDASQPYSTENFASGNLSMMLNYLSIYPQLKSLNAKLNISVYPAPQRDVKTFPIEDLPGGTKDPIYTARYRALVVSKPWQKLSSKQQDEKTAAAWQFINFASAPTTVQAYTQQVKLLSPFMPTQTTQTSTNLFAFPGSSTTSTENLVTPYLRTWYRGNAPRSVDRIMNDMIRAVTETGVEPQAALDQTAGYVSSMLQ